MPHVWPSQSFGKVVFRTAVAKSSYVAGTQGVHSFSAHDPELLAMWEEEAPALRALLPVVLTSRNAVTRPLFASLVHDVLRGLSFNAFAESVRLCHRNELFNKFFLGASVLEHRMCDAPNNSVDQGERPRGQQVLQQYFAVAPKRPTAGDCGLHCSMCVSSLLRATTIVSMYCGSMRHVFRIVC